MSLIVSRSRLSSLLLVGVALCGHFAYAAPPDILGVTMGMSAADAYNAVKAVDVTHRVTVGQVAIPELLGNKTAVFKMQPETGDTANAFYVNLTLPPNPQVVWQVYHQIGPMHVTRDQALTSLLSKYGSTFRSRAPCTPTSGVCTFRWIYDEQGNLSAMPFSQEAICTQTINVMDTLGVPAVGNVSGETVYRSPQADVQLRPISPAYDPARLPQCQHLVWVEAQLQGVDLTWTIMVTITDYDLQHRGGIALYQFFNGLATKQQNQNVNQAEHTAVPKL
jgi:hypothetical protein